MGARRSGGRLREMKVERDKDRQDGEKKMKHRWRDEMSMLIKLYHNRVLRNNGHIYIMPVILHQQLQYICYLSFFPP